MRDLLSCSRQYGNEDGNEGQMRAGKCFFMKKEDVSRVCKKQIQETISLISVDRCRPFAYLFVNRNTGTIISSRLTPPCWKVFL